MADVSEVTADEVVDMVRHWLNTPPNRFYGSSYGISIKEMLQKPMSQSDADLIVQKMREDLPIIDLIPNSVNVFLENIQGRSDAKRLLIQVYESIIDAANPFEDVSL